MTALDFEPGSIEPHLHMNLRLRDEQGKVLATSRDLDALRAKFGGRAGDAFAARAGREMAADGLRTFPATPIPLQVPGEAGVPAYPALLDEGDSVALRIFADRQQAQEAHPLGVRRLLEIALAEKVKQARKQLPVGAKTGLLYAAIESQERLRGDLVDAAMNAVLAEGLEDIRDAAAFEQRREHAAKALFGEAMSRLNWPNHPGAGGGTEADAGSTVDGLGARQPGRHGSAAVRADPPRFLRDTPADALAQYPRYLKAMILRTERAKRDPPRDQARMLELHPFLEALERRSSRACAIARNGRRCAGIWKSCGCHCSRRSWGHVPAFGEEAGAAGDGTAPGLVTPDRPRRTMTGGVRWDVIHAWRGSTTWSGAPWAGCSRLPPSCTTRPSRRA